MAEIRLDPISTLMPLGSRSMAPTMEFASYLDEAWSQFTTTTATDSPGRNLPAPARAAHDTTGRGEQRKDARKKERGNDGKDVHGGAGANAAAARQQQAHSNESAAAPSDAPANEATPNNNGSPPTQAAADASGNARETEASQPQTAAQEEAVLSETPVTAADAAPLDVPSEVGQKPAAEGETPATIDLSGTSEDAVTETSATAAEIKTPAVGEVSNEAPSSEGETGNKGENTGNGESNTEKPSGLQEAVDGASMSGQEAQPEEPAETAESRSRHGQPITAKDAGRTHEAQAADLSQEQAVDTPAQAAGAAGTTADASPSAAAAATTAVTPVETSRPTAPSANTTSVEPVEGVATGTNRAASGEPGARAASAASGTPEADQAGAVERARFVQRVAQAFQATGDRGGTIRMRLSPPELGSLRVEITVNRGVMNAQMETETDAARQLVLENLPALRERLAEQGIKVEQFQVDVSDREAGGQPNQFEDRSHSDRSGAESRRHSTARGTRAQEAESQVDRRAHHVGETSRLDVLV